MSQGDVKDRMAAGGSEVVTGTPEQLAAKLKSDDTRMRKLFKDIGLSLIWGNPGRTAASC